MKESHFNRFVIISFFISIFAGVFILFFLQRSMKASAPYKKTVEYIHQEKVIQEALGTPIQEGFFVSGMLEIKEKSGKAKLSVPLSGPKGSGVLYASLEKKGDDWRFFSLIFQIEDKEINLLE
ncbi:cytochrome c oxidase assembly factor Coa1 family protein [Candidatus Uabimicrobium amorphum]|uniref:Cytochrome oxidase complex assembly protein 1 n=1 Tax=Uabimicrobium amorphum TaxID=2596890 RepID=A0A5S9ITW4_UABAM|nr:cytochrome c oxidase assembly factor Coa1 family protein [Candidatus Uabimicrobium amorphum]BBM87536.1 hypothetical protein UABAM_05948 [Candidatus Uabimicrobium amorphum]